MEIPLNGLIFEEFHKNESCFTLFGFLKVSSFCNPAGWWWCHFASVVYEQIFLG